jgi:hypothetical protein
MNSFSERTTLLDLKVTEKKKLKYRSLTLAIIFKEFITIDTTPVLEFYIKKQSGFPQVPNHFCTWVLLKIRPT